jgi:hypothetical protein
LLQRLTRLLSIIIWRTFFYWNLESCKKERINVKYPEYLMNSSRVDVGKSLHKIANFSFMQSYDIFIFISEKVFSKSANDFSLSLNDFNPNRKILFTFFNILFYSLRNWTRMRMRKKNQEIQFKLFSFQ